MRSPGLAPARVTRHRIASPFASFPHQESLSPGTASARSASASARKPAISSAENTPRTKR